MYDLLLPAKSIELDYEHLSLTDDAVPDLVAPKCACAALHEVGDDGTWQAVLPGRHMTEHGSVPTSPPRYLPCWLVLCIEPDTE